MFADRIDAGVQLASRLRGRVFRNPLVLGIPRGGCVVANEVARELGAEFDVAIAKKILAPGESECAIGAVGEDGLCYVAPWAGEGHGVSEAYLRRETARVQSELAHRQDLYRGARLRASIKDRSVIIVDDGIATGATMTAALQAVRKQAPYELIAAVPVAPPYQLDEVRRWCDDAVAVISTKRFWSVGQFYGVFNEVGDAEVVLLLAAASATRAPSVAAPESSSA